MKILVCGGRDYGDEFGERAALFAYLDELRREVHDNASPITEVIQGGARGADRLAQEWAVARNIICTTVNARWSEHGKAAGMIRNAEMLKYEPDLVVAFRGGKGTEGMVKLAIKAGVKVRRVE